MLSLIQLKDNMATQKNIILKSLCQCMYPKKAPASKIDNTPYSGYNPLFLNKFVAHQKLRIPPPLFYGESHEEAHSLHVL